jgi:hypothetical protein
VKSSSPLHVVKASALIWLSVGLLLGMQFLHSTSKHLVCTSVLGPVRTSTYNVHFVHVLQYWSAASVLHVMVGYPFFSFCIPLNYL